MYVFAFDSRTACSRTRDSIYHMKLFQSIQDDILEQSYLDKNLFEDDKSSPGRIFFGIHDSIDMKLFENDIGLVVNKALFIDFQTKITSVKIREEDVTLEMRDSLYNKLYTMGKYKVVNGKIKSEYCPFSGGGDIMILNTEGILLQTNSGQPCSPTETEDELEFDIENKIAIPDGDALVQQLLSNMMVALSY